MLRVGLTGNVASGKSTVARRWRELGLTVVDADVLARQAVAPGSDGLERVRASFGGEVIDREGGLDRAALRRVVFRDEAARTLLESIVHPEVERLRRERDRQAEQAGETLIVHEIPLLFEVGLEDEFDVVVLVDAPEEVRLDRLLRDRGLEREEARRIIEAQMPTERKRRRAHHVLDNSGERADLLRQADRLADALRSRAGERSQEANPEEPDA